MTTPNQETPSAEAPPAAVVQTAPLDADDLELQEALAAAKAEEPAAGSEGEQGQPGAAAATPAIATPPAGAAPKDQPEAQAPVMIPKDRFDQVNTQKAEAERQAAYWRGVAEARAQQPQHAAAPAVVVETPEQKIGAIRANRSVLAARFDAGELTMAEWDTQRLALEDEERVVREAAFTERLKPREQPAARQQMPQQGEPLYLDTVTSQLEREHPYVGLIESDTDFKWLHSKAVEQLVAEGKLPQDGKPIGDRQIYETRKRIAELSDTYGPTLTGKTPEEVGLKVQTSQVQAQPGKPALSPEAQARAAKLALQGTLPPDITAMTGTPGNPQGDVSDAQLESMSDEDIGKLPVAVRNRLLGIT